MPKKELKINLQVSGTPGNLWIIDGNKRYGPFACWLDASWTVIEMISDRSHAYFGNSVFFLAPKGTK